MAEPANGNNSVITLTREATWGVVNPSPSPNKILILPGGGMVGDQKLIQNEMIGSDPNPRDPASGNQSAAGSFETNPNTDNLPYLMELGLGSRVTTGVGPYVHTSKLVSGLIPSVSMEESLDLAAGTKFKQSLGCRFDKTKFEWASEGILKTSHTLLGKSVTGLAATTIGAVVQDWTTQPLFDHLMLAAADVKLNGSAVAQIISGVIEVNHNHFPDHFVSGGAGARRSLPRRRATVGGTIKTFLEDSVIYNLALNGTFVALDLKWTNGAVLFQLIVPRVRLKRTDPKIANGPLEMEFELVGSKDATLATSVETIVTNAIAGTVYAA
jgi:hypothetical protein